MAYTYELGTTMNKIKQYDVFILAKDVNPVIKKGMSGVILEIWADNSFEIEFVKEDGTNHEYGGLSTFTIDQSFIEKITWTSNESFIDVYESYKFSDGRIVAFLKSPDCKIPTLTILEDDSGSQWRIKQYFWTTGSAEAYEKTEKEESQNIFQYLLEGINQNEKPTKGSKLKTIRCV